MHLINETYQQVVVKLKRSRKDAETQRLKERREKIGNFLLNYPTRRVAFFLSLP